MLQDSLARDFSYLRLSITDQCNFRCVYCLPDGYTKQHGPSYLSVDEIRRLCLAFAELGLAKVRLTGGEPTLRQDFASIVRAVQSIAGVTKICLSTNGYNLLKKATEFKALGINGINVSIDTLCKDKFKAFTGHDKLTTILQGIDKALEIGLGPIKVNAVLMQGINDTEVEPFIHWVKQVPISVRFIELMPTAVNRTVFKERHISADSIRQRLLKQGWLLSRRAHDAGPAETYTHPEYQGTVGIIAPYSPSFCQTCNRLRVTSVGNIKLCLFSDKDYVLRKWLQHDEQKDELIHTIKQLIGFKADAHALSQQKIGNVMHFAQMGG